MRNQNSPRPIIVYGLPQIIDGLKAAGFSVVTGSNFVETGRAAKQVFDQIGSTYLVVGDDQAAGLQQWCDRAIAQGCPTVHVLMPGTAPRLNLPQATQLQAPLTAADVIDALGLNSAPAEPQGWGAQKETAPSPRSSSQPASGWGAKPVSEASGSDDLSRMTPRSTAPTARASSSEPGWGNTPQRSLSDIPAMPQVIEPDRESAAEDMFSSTSGFTPASHQEEDTPWAAMSNRSSSADEDRFDNQDARNKPQGDSWDSGNGFGGNDWGQPNGGFTEPTKAEPRGSQEFDRGFSNNERAQPASSGNDWENRQAPSNNSEDNWNQPADEFSQGKDNFGSNDNWNAPSRDSQPDNFGGSGNWDNPQSPSNNSEDNWNQSTDEFSQGKDNFGSNDNWNAPSRDSQPDNFGGSGDWDNNARSNEWEQPANSNTRPAENEWEQPATPSRDNNWDQQDNFNTPPAPVNEWEQAPKQPVNGDEWEQNNFSAPSTPANDWDQPTKPSQGNDWDQPNNSDAPSAPANDWGQPATQGSANDWDQNNNFGQSSEGFGGNNDWNQQAGYGAPATNDWNQQPGGFDSTPAEPIAPIAPVVAAAAPLRSRNGHGYIAPTGPKVGSVILVLGGKGGIGKSTMSLQIANSLANAGYKTCLIDGNVGQPDLTAYLRIINGKHGGKELPSIYQAATIGERAAVIAPDVLNAARTGYEEVKFGFVAGAPAHLNDANIVTEDIYANVIAKCQEEMSYVVVDLQIIEQSNRSAMVESVVIPALKQGGYAMALSDMSSPGVNNLRYVLTRLKEEENMDMSRISMVLNRVENEQMPVASMVESQFKPLGVDTVGIVSANKSLQAITNSGMLDLGDTEITNAVRRFIRETLGLPAAAFPEVESSGKAAKSNNTTAKSGGFLNLFRKK